MAAPFEILAAPVTIYVAVTGTAFPLIDAAPAVAWKLVGKSGTKNYSDDGVSVTHEQDISEFTPVGATVPRKVWRVGESLKLTVEVADVSIDAYSQALNDAAITTVVASSGIAGQKSLAMFRGDQVKTFALLARGMSPDNEVMNAQYEVPLAYQGSDSYEITYKKGEPAMISMEFIALSDDTGNFGRYRVGTNPAI